MIYTQRKGRQFNGRIQNISAIPSICRCLSSFYITSDYHPLWLYVHNPISKTFAPCLNFSSCKCLWWINFYLRFVCLLFHHDQQHKFCYHKILQKLVYELIVIVSNLFVFSGKKSILKPEDDSTTTTPPPQTHSVVQTVEHNKKHKY